MFGIKAFAFSGDIVAVLSGPLDAQHMQQLLAYASCDAQVAHAHLYLNGVHKASCLHLWGTWLGAEPEKKSSSRLNLRESTHV